MKLSLAALVLAFTVNVIGAPLNDNDIELAAAHSCTCAGAATGSTAVYTTTEVSNGIATGQGGSYGGYPHVFNNREGISFPLCGGATFMEYPIRKGTSYTGGAPGADRVIYNRANGNFCGCITHNGASTVNGFVACSWT
ncbi:Ribonuclease/ribotoxin [Fomes fomentarius]|nr:Ribonuclease/ribotoxin [Fomes fomentarius]